MASLLQRLAVVISGDDKGAVSALERTAVAEEKLAVLEAKLAVERAKGVVIAEREAIQSAKAAGDADAEAAAKARLTVAQTKASAARLEFNKASNVASTAQAERDLASGAKGLESAAGGAGKLEGALGSLGVVGPAAAAATVAGFAKLEVDSVESFANLTESVRNFQLKSGATAEDASKLTAAFKVAGVDSDAAATGIFRLARQAENAKNPLHDVGVEVARNANGTVNLSETFLNVADAMQKVGPGAQADAIAFAAFGRQGQALVPILLQGRQGIADLYGEADRHHEIVTQDQIDKGHQFTIEMREATAELEGLKIEAGQALLPMATGFLKVGEAVASALDHLGVFKTIMQTIVGGPLGPGIAMIAGLFHHGSDSAKELADAQQQAAAAAMEQATAEDTAATAATKAQQALDGLSSATGSYNSSVDAVTEADKKVAAAHAEVATKAQDEAKATADAQKATDDLARASDALSKAQRDVALNIALANEEAKKSLDDVADKTDAVNVATEKYGATSHQASSAQDDLALARDKATQAQRKADDLKAQGDRPDAVLQAEQQVASAKERQATAAQEKTKADKEDPAGDLAKAERDRAEAGTKLLTDQVKLNDAITTYNAQWGTSITFADILHGKLNDILTTQLQINAAQSPAGPSSTPYRDQAVLPAGSSAAVDASRTAATAARGGLGDPSNPFVQQNTTINVYAQTDNPNDLANVIDRKLATSTRARVQ